MEPVILNPALSLARLPRLRHVLVVADMVGLGEILIEVEDVPHRIEAQGQRRLAIHLSSGG